ncbi:hypothetical protein HOD08_02320 [bacterium]|nr:hypothetical protein [bacterium]
MKLKKISALFALTFALCSSLQVHTGCTFSCSVDYEAALPIPELKECDNKSEQKFATECKKLMEKIRARVGKSKKYLNEFICAREQIKTSDNVMKPLKKTVFVEMLAHLYVLAEGSIEIGIEAVPRDIFFQFLSAYTYDFSKLLPCDQNEEFRFDYTSFLLLDIISTRFEWRKAQIRTLCSKPVEKRQELQKRKGIAYELHSHFKQFDFNKKDSDFYETEINKIELEFDELYKEQAPSIKELDEINAHEQKIKKYMTTFI